MKKKKGNKKGRGGEKERTRKRTKGEEDEREEQRTLPSRCVTGRSEGGRLPPCRSGSGWTGRLERGRVLHHLTHRSPEPELSHSPMLSC